MGLARTAAFAASLWLGTFTTCSASSLAPPVSSPMRIGGDGAPPSGFVAFCERIPAECAPRGSAHPIRSEAVDHQATATISTAVSRAEPSIEAIPVFLPHSSRVRLSPARWVELQDVNLAFNQAIIALPDEAAFGRREYWTLPLSLEGVAVGDCEDFALEKRRALIARGWPEDGLLLAALVAPGYGRHAVLVVVTDEGDYVLDNLHDEVRAWSSTGYDWQVRQDATNPLRWVTLSNMQIAQE
jgi:predicted transglutaminase-like cysteine proteinase